MHLSVGPAVAAAALALAVAGCGQPGDASPGSDGGTRGAAGSPPAAGRTKAQAPVTVTAGVQESTVSLRVGQAVLVRPAPGRTGPANALLAEVSSSVLRPAGGNSTTGWRFVARGRGIAHIVVSYAPQCVPGELCPMFRGLLGRVTVTVE